MLICACVEFSSYTKQNGIHHRKSAPNQPIFNKLAESTVLTIKGYNIMIKPTTTSVGNPLKKAFSLISDITDFILFIYDNGVFNTLG